MNRLFSLLSLFCRTAFVACLATFLLLSQSAISASILEPRSAADWMTLFQVPSLLDSWEIDSQINGHNVHLRLPDESVKLRSYTQDVRAIITQREHFRLKNLEILRKSISTMAEVLKNNSLRLAPEYEQSLNRILLSIYPDIESRQGIYRHLPLLRALPDYTKFTLFVPEHMKEQIESELTSSGFRNRYQVHAVVMPTTIEQDAVVRFPTTVWARDLLEVAVEAKTGATYGLVPLAHARTENLTLPDNEYLHELANQQFQTVAIPLFFRSGNLVVGEANGHRYLFVGDRELSNLKNYYYNAFFFIPPDSAVLELLKTLSGAESVVILHNSEHLFHLDMMMVFLAPDAVAILNPVDPEKMVPEDRDTLTMARQNLSRLGFKITDIPTTSGQISSFQSPTNAIAFRHQKTDRATILVPQFEKKTLRQNNTDVVLQDLVERAYRSAGYDVFFVQDLFSDIHGNIHCAVHSLY